MKKALVAGIAALVIAGSTAVYAQHRYFHHHPRMSMQDRAAFLDAKIASVKAGLQLTPDQAKNWPPVEAAVRDFAKQRMDRANARALESDARRAELNQPGPNDRGPQDRATPDQKPDPVARLRERANNMAETAAGLKKIADAADPLYKSLDDGQKRRLALLIRRGGPNRGWDDHGFDHGPGGPFDHGGDHGPGRGRGPGGDRGPADGPQRL